MITFICRLLLHSILFIIYDQFVQGVITRAFLRVSRAQRETLRARARYEYNFQSSAKLPVETYHLQFRLLCKTGERSEVWVESTHRAGAQLFGKLKLCIHVSEILKFRNEIRMSEATTDKRAPPGRIQFMRN